MNDPVNQNKARQKSTVILLIVVFASPFIAALIIYNFTDFGGDGINNSHGRLILPPGQVADLEPVDPVTGGGYQLHGKWNLIYPTSGVCGKECMRTLDIIRDARAALANDSYRVQLVLAVDKHNINDVPETRLAEMRILVLDKTALMESLKESDMGPESISEDSLYLIDPLGNLMMRYSPESTRAGIIKDLKRLLRNSRIG